MNKQIIKFMMLFIFLLVRGSAYSQTPALIQREYFIDIDPGLGRGFLQSFSAADSVNQSISIATGSLSIGTHNLYVRWADSAGHWGLLTAYSFQVVDTANAIAANNRITGGEYFVDVDPGAGHGTAVSLTPGDSVTHNLAVNTNNLSIGTHTLYLRYQRYGGQWGELTVTPFTVTDTARPGANQVTSGEYFVDTDPGPGNATPFTVTTADTTTDNITVGTTGLFAGPHALYIRYKRTGNRWGQEKVSYFTIDSVTNGADYINSIAGTGTAGATGDSAVALNAQLRACRGIAVDAAYNIYIADSGNHKVRKIAAGTGNITTIAGNGTAGFSGDGNAATAAKLNGPSGIAVDASGNVYVVDKLNHRIRKITPAGIISTVAGNGSTGTSTDGVAATAATLNSPSGIATDATGNLYIADGGHHTIRKVTAATSIISTIAGTGASGISGDGSAATAAKLNNPQAVCLDTTGNIYIADYGNQRIRRINTSGTIATYAGTGTSGYTGDGGAATAARIAAPLGVTADRLGNVYIADAGNNRIRKIASGTISTFAGTGSANFAGDNGPATAADLNAPSGVAADYGGNVFVADRNNNRARKIGKFISIANDGTTTICSGSLSIFNATIYGLAYTTTPHYQWKRNNTNTGGDNPIFSSSALANNDTIWCQLTDSLGRVLTRSTGIIMKVDTLPTVAPAISGPSSVCQAGSATYTHIVNNGVWSMSDYAVASVATSAGMVYGVAVGSTIITYTVTNACGTYFSTKSITVTTNVPVLSAIAGSSRVCPATTITLSDTALSGTWSSSTPSIASVVATTGVVRGVAAGNTTITYTKTTSCGTNYATMDITVDPLPGSAGTITTTCDTVCVGSYIYLRSNGGGNWASRDTNLVAAFDGYGYAAPLGSFDGYLLGLRSGTATISYNVTTNCGTNRVTRSIKVVDTPALSIISGSDVICRTGNTTSFTNTVSGGTWSTADASIASVNASGLVKAMASGTTIISYSKTSSCGSYTAETRTNIKVKTINVLPYPFAVPSISGTTNMCTGGTATFSNSLPTGTCSSSAPAVVTIGNTGLATALSAGTSVISYSVANTCGTGLATITITVTKTPAAGSITGPNDVCVGTTAALTDSAGGGSWSSMSSSIGTVSNSGLFTALSAGTAHIIYFVYNSCGSILHTTDITVNATYVAPISGATSVCSGSTTTFTDSTSGGTWGTSNPLIATVNTGGQVTGIGAGTATISYSKGGSCGTSTAVRSIAVTTTPLPDTIGGPSSICTTGTYSLTDLYPGGTWASLNTSVATVSASGMLQGITSGSASIIYFLSNSCGTALHSRNISVSAPAMATITGGASVCAGATLALSGAPSGGIWATSSGAAATVSASGSVYGLASGTAMVSYTVTNVCGSVSAVDTINVLSTPTAGSIGGRSSLCAGDTAMLTDALSGGSWVSLNTAVATVNNLGLVTAVSPGATSILYSVSNACGAVTHTLTLSVTGSAIAAISGASATCVGSTVGLTNASPSGIWTVADSTIATIGSTGQIAGRNAGNTTVSYTLTNVCGTLLATMPFTVAAPFEGGITGPTIACVGTPASFTTSTSGGTWASSNATVATVDSAGNVRPIAAGSVVIGYTLTNACGTVSRNAILNVYPVPVVGPISGTTTLCSGQFSSLTDSLAGGTWSVTSPSVASIDATGVLTGLSAGTTNISYTIANSCGTAVATTSATVNPLPDAGSIVGATSICAGNSITLTNATAGGRWSTLDTTTGSINSTGQVTSYAAGTITVTYTVSNSCGSSFTTKAITVNPLPSAGAISGSSTVCVGASVALTASVSGGYWTNAPRILANVSSTGSVYGLAAGIDTILYQVTNTCGTATASMLITVNPLPVSGTISGAISLTTGAAATYVSTASGGTWSVTNTTLASINAGNVTALAVGVDTIKYTTSNSCGTATSQLAVVISSSATSIISGPTAVCLGSTITLSSIVTGGTWTSSNAAYASVSASTGVVRGVATGTATITYAVGTSRFTYPINIHSTVVTTLTGSTSVCLGASTLFSNASAGGTWTSARTGITSVSPSGIVFGIGAGVDTIRYTYTNSCGTFSTTKTITVNGYSNVLSISGSGSAICVGATRTNTNPTAGGVWSLSDTTLARITSVAAGSVTVVGVAAGFDTVRYTITNSCGLSTTATIPLRVNATPYVAAIAGANAVCARATTTLTDSVSGGTWTSANTTVASITSGGGLLTGVAAGTTTITYTIATACGTNYTTSSITVNPLPDAVTITGPTVACIGTPTAYSASLAGGTWTNTPTVLATVNSTGVVTGWSAGSDTLLYSLTNGCGTTTTAKVLTVTPLPFAGTITGDTLLAAGFTTAFTASVAGGTWSSTNTVLGTVSTAGLVMGLSNGLDTIKYTYTNSCGTDVAQKAIRMTLDAGTLSGPTGVCIGSTGTLTSTIAGGSWNSSSTAIATVNTTGVVYGLLSGTVTITYSYGLARSYYLVAIQAPSIGAITGGSTSVCPGSTMTLANATAGGVWTCSALGRSTVAATGVVTAISPGADTIKYTVVNACGTYEARKYITISGPTNPLAISGSSASICPGASRTNTDATTGGTWSLSGTGIATITPSGTSVVVTGLAGGTDTLKYTLVNSCGLSGIVRSVVTVNPAAVAGTISGSTSVIIGNTITINNAGASGTGTWSHSAPTIASITGSGTSCSVRGRAAGIDTVKYTVTNTCGSAVARMVVTVTAAKEAGALATTTATAINVYPNPATGKAYIVASEAINALYVTDVTGKILQQLSGNEPQMEIDLSYYASGTYLLRVFTTSSEQVVKIVKE